MKKIQTSFYAVVLSLTVILGVVGSSVLAATNSIGNGGNGMRVSPVRSDLVIQPGGSKVISVFIQNVTGSNATYKVLANDFVAADDESGAPALLLNGEVNDKHGLKKFLSAQESVSVEAGKQKEIKVSISIPKGTAGGGYYGAIRFAPFTKGSNGQNVTLSGSVGSLILVKVPGDVTEKLSLVSFDARKDNEPRTLFTSNKSIEATVRLRNEGNIQEQPFGKIILRKGSKIVGQYEINGGSQPGNVLPDSIRKFSVDLKKVGSFGKYTLEGNFGYGSDGQLLSAKTTFYVIPLWAIVIGLLLVGFILFLIFGMPRLVRNYNKRVLRKAGRR